jgi:general stress protein 26
MSDHHSDSSDNLDTIRSIMKDVRTCMFVTTTAEGSLHASPMTTQEAEFDGDAWFIASTDSNTVRNLRVHPQVNVAYSGTSSWLSLSGSATVVDARGKKKELWNTFVEAWFPEGQDDPSIVVVKVSGESAHYWESPGRVAMTLDMVKARVTGSTPKSSDSGTVDL